VKDLIKILMWIAIGTLLGQAFQGQQSVYASVGAILFCVLWLYLGKVFMNFSKKRKKRLATKLVAKQAYESALNNTKKVTRKRK
jgi:uncharacterized BrkB/YihY/UPF0761 family membrane protein